VRTESIFERLPIGAGRSGAEPLPGARVGDCDTGEVDPATRQLTTPGPSSIRFRRSRSWDPQHFMRMRGTECRSVPASSTASAPAPTCSSADRHLDRAFDGPGHTTRELGLLWGRRCLGHVWKRRGAARGDGRGPADPRVTPPLVHLIDVVSCGGVGFETGLAQSATDSEHPQRNRRLRYLRA